MSVYGFSCAEAAILFFFFFNDTATTEIYTLSLHDALPICSSAGSRNIGTLRKRSCLLGCLRGIRTGLLARSEEHTSELQSQSNLVCRLLLEKKKCREKQRALRARAILSTPSPYSTSTCPRV